MKAYERLLRLSGHNLVVFYAEESIAVEYEDAEVTDGVFRKGIYGTGETFEQACEDYIEKITGKTLVFGYGDKRKEVIVI